MGKFDDLKRLRDSAAESLKDADSLSKAIDTTRTVAGAAANEAKITNRKGEVSTWRVARAAVRPTKTGRRLITGAVAGVSEVSSSQSGSAGVPPPEGDGQPGWYPDPMGSFHHRYWNGGAWTADVATNGDPSTDPDWSARFDSPRDMADDMQLDDPGSVQMGSQADPGDQTAERTCPWCAETIKAAAIICRFCNREVETGPTAL